MYEFERLFIDGEWSAPIDGEVAVVRSPHDNTEVGRVAMGGPADIDRAVAAARHAFDHSDWPALDPADRIAACRRLRDVYLRRAGEMGEIVMREMGSPRWFCDLAQGPGAAFMLDTFCSMADGYEFEFWRQGLMAETLVRRVPVGVVGAITAWNVPQLVIMPKLAPALIAGCTVVVKPSPEAPLDALLLAEFLEEAEIPPGVVNIVPGGREAGEHLVRHVGIDKVAFTGSSAVGRSIASICGERLARFSLELGGKSAAIVLDDAHPEKTATGLKFATYINNGQACVAQTRVLVPRAREAEFLDALAAMTEGVVVGDPADPDTYVGPLVSARQRERVEGYIQVGLDEGAVALTGGLGRPEGFAVGNYVRPTVFGSVTNQMRVAREEIFGPVMCVIPYDNEDDAVAIANDSDYGLAGSVWTKDSAHGAEVARRIRTGMVGINQFGPDLAAPFGGMKHSGIGREYGPEGLEQYLEIQALHGLSR